MRKMTNILLCMLLAVASCKSVAPDPVPDPNPEPEPEPTPVVTGKPRYIWIDASANFYYYANDKAYIATEMRKVAQMGFTDIIVDVRPTEGSVLFKSETAPQARRLAAWVKGSYRYVNRTANWDYLQAFIDAGHAAGLKVNAAMNTFVGGYGGYYGLESEGPIFSGNMPTSWATVRFTEDGLKSSYYEGVQGTIFVNPVNPEVQEYMLKLIRELAAYEDLDGIILDRCRFDDSNLDSDFSEVTKEKFTEFLGHAPQKWPVFDSPQGHYLPSSLSAEQKRWMSFRVKTIHDFVEKASNAAHEVRSDIRFGCYVGAWYSSYYESGVNWASPKCNVKTYYKWADDDYQQFGYADHCDFMMLGCYASASSIYGVGEWTMQGFCKRARNILLDDTVFAGGPDVGNPSGWENGGKGDILYKTVDACINQADGYFLFDLCHIRMYDYWSDMEDAIDKYKANLK